MGKNRSSLPHCSSLLLAVILCCQVTAGYAGDKPTELKGKALKPFIELMQNNLKAWSFHKDDKQFDEAGIDYSKRPDALFWDTSLPLQGFRGWDEYQHVIKSWLAHGIEQADITVIDTDQFKGWRYKDVVWNLMHCEVALVLANGDRPRPRCRGTSIWEWEGDRWRLAHETFSMPVALEQSVFQGQRSADPRIEPHQELMRLAKEVAAAWGAGAVSDLPQRLEKYYLKTAELTIYTPWQPMPVYRGWDAFVAGVAQHLAPKAQRISIQVNNDLEAHRRGRLAWSHATLHLETQLPDGSINPGDARQTLIWYLTDEGWRILHEHFSFPQG
jgi:ketosteroid isomerase-like protein